MRRLNSVSRIVVINLVSLSVLPAILHQSATAQQPPPPLVSLGPVVVSASRIPTSLAKTPESITVITREQIEAQQPISVVDLLRQVVGVHIDQPGGRGGISSVYTRGSDPNFTVVLIDGVKVNDPTNSRGGSFDFSTLDPAAIERVEVVRGPLSSVHGSDAMGGVINIVTRQGTATPTIAIDSSGGWHGSARAGFAASGPLGPARYAVNFSYVDDGHPVEGSNFTSKSLNAKLTFPPSSSTWLQLISRFADSHGESFPDDSGGPEFAVLRAVDKRDSQELTLGAEFSHEIRSWWEYTIKADFYDRQEEVVSPGVAPGVRDPFGIPPNRSDTSFRRTTLVVSGLFSVLAAVQGTIGAELQFEEGDSDSILLLGDSQLPGRFALNRAIYAPFLEVQYASAFGLTLDGGLRLDEPDRFDAEVSPRVGALYHIPSTWTTLKANWGKGFKLPSFFALGNPIVGNPQLIPETSEGVDVGVVQGLWNQQTHLSATLFYNRFFNLIDFDAGPPPQLVNRSKVITQGVELGLDTEPINTLWINAHLTYLETDIAGTNQELRHRPHWRGGVNARWRPKANLVFSFDTLYVGDTFDSSIPTGDRTLDDYLRVDVAATMTLFSHWQLLLAINNLFDAHYEEAVGFPSPGITPRIAARFSF